MMKTIPLFLVAVVAGLASPPPNYLVDPVLQGRMGWDSNPAGTSGTSAEIQGRAETLVFAAGVSLGVQASSPGPSPASVKLTYAAETVRFDEWSGEDFSTHRLGASAAVNGGSWSMTAEGSTLFVDGSRDTLVSVPSTNANATSLWRERRRQWQHRLRLQAVYSTDAWVLRPALTVLDYDYNTRIAPGHVAFADRSDVMGAVDLGWKQAASSLWFAGVRIGRQLQATIPLPNCEFDYANDYRRLAVGWEGKAVADTTVAFAAGPDFRRYNGNIDTRVFLGGRDRTSLWFEGSVASKVSSRLSLTARAVRMDWLSSTGKSAYIDSMVEAAATWKLTAASAFRLTGKLHRCDYFPTVRDDWESFLGVGITSTLSPRVQLAFDLMRHRAWNNLAAFNEREFVRGLLNVGATVKL